MVLHWVVAAFLLGSSMVSAQVVVPPAAPVQAAPAPAAPPAATGPAWAGKPVRASHWITLEGTGDKKFLVNSDEFDKFKSGTAEAAPLALYEGAIPESGWMPSWEAVKNWAIWSTAATVKLSEYRLEKPKGGGVAYDAVKGEERVAVIESGRGGRMTVATVSISKPADPPAPAAPQTAAPSPVAATPPAQVAPNPTHPHTETGTDTGTGTSASPAPASGYADPALDAAVRALFPGEDGAAELAAQMVRLENIERPGAKAEFIAAVAAANGNLSALKQSWQGKMNAACSGGRGAIGGSALEQAQALAGQFPGADGSIEDVRAGTDFDAGPLYGPCLRWKGRPAPSAAQRQIRRVQEQVGRTPDLTARVTPTPEPPPPSSTAERTAPDAAAGAPAKKGGLSGGIFKFLAVLVGAALGAVAGSFMGPAAGLVGMAVGAGLGLWAAGKVGSGGSGGATEKKKKP
ncbi:MAG: hypothetical protein HY925_14040 [Elusimicrobia bacterium]|nr:hypothetical protein [Elusimicrobiota bacterium]